MLELFDKLKKKDKVIGITFSCFELCHPGHIDMLYQCKSQCDYLIVGLLTNQQNDRPESKNKPIETTFERWMRLQSISIIDYIIPFDTEEDIINIINVIKPNVRFVGKEYEGIKHTGWDLCPIIYNDRNHNWSSTNLRNKILQEELNKNK